ncbi:MAG: lysophospholipid acyltransferase family protein [Flavobacteriales bacterium]|nr:lysophospholipid acyltransferase family protein [Flavobacteriales bacterium]
MIYSFLKLLFRITVKAFFKHQETINIEHIPVKGPVILVANHPSTFMDPIIIATKVPREVSFIAKSTAFKSKFTSWILPKFNMIPVFRAQDDPSQMHKNQQTFEKVFQLLERNGCILIFPEGISLTERKLKEIKTGAARMALGAEARNNFSLGVKILPIGLTYSDQHSFQSDLLVRIGEPIELINYKDSYNTDPLAAGKQITEEIRVRLEKLTIDIQDEEVDLFVKDVETVYKSQLIRDMGFSKEIPEHDYIVTKLIYKRIHYYLETDPDRVSKVRQYMDNYKRLLNKLNLEDHIIRGKRRRSSAILNFIGLFLYFLIGFPLFVFGTFNNYIPYKLPYRIAIWSKVEAQYIGAIMMVSGTFVFLIFYLLQIYLVQWWISDWRVTAVYTLVLPLSGLFAYNYWKAFTQLRRKWHFISLFMKKKELVSQLITMRTQIMDELEKGRKEYDKAHPVAPVQ